ncbi:uncharacterized protein TNCV_4848071 [Trichonephila clavipes]|nr:uncharacterized protein TNCV_4848071 [Trichonephila clavipes]
MGSTMEIKEWRQEFMPLNFPVEDIHLIVQLAVLFNACIKLGFVIDVFPYQVPHLQRIPAEDVLRYALAHPESSVRNISKACSYSKSTVPDCISLRESFEERLECFLDKSKLKKT